MERWRYQHLMRGLALLVITLGTTILLSGTVQAEDPPGCRGGCMTLCLNACDNDEYWCTYSCTSKTGEEYAQCVDDCWSNYLACRNECISNCDLCAG